MADPKPCVCKFCKGSLGPYVWGPMTPQAVPPVSMRHRYGASILALVSSHRDPRCGQTVYNIFNRAARPERMHVAIVDQQLPDVDKFDCVALYCALHKPRACPHLERIQTLRVDARNAEGPLWARGLGTQMVKDEHEFCMQIDAHTDFRNDYDELTLMTWAMTGNEYAVLSTYVGNIRKDINAHGETIVGLPQHEVPIICRIMPGGYGLVRNRGADGSTCEPGPILAALWGAGLSFAKCHFERNVPNDPRLAGLFDGEEFARTIRGFTKGYDIYSMHRPTVFHDYGGYPGDAVRGGLSWKGAAGGRSARLWRDIILHGKDKGTAWGLGTLRTVEQYTNMTAVDPYHPGNREQEQRKRCTHLEYVPYVDDPSRLSAPLPEIDEQFPRNVQKGTDPLPEIDDKFIGVARRMLPKDQAAPKMSPEQQRIQYGVPPEWLWPREDRREGEVQQRAQNARQQQPAPPSSQPETDPQAAASKELHRVSSVASSSQHAAAADPAYSKRQTVGGAVQPSWAVPEASTQAQLLTNRRDEVPFVQARLSAASRPIMDQAQIIVVLTAPLLLFSSLYLCKTRICVRRPRRATRNRPL